MNNFSNEGLPEIIKEKKDIVGLEIGVERGYSALHLLKSCSVKKIYIIDPYLPYYDSGSNHVCDEVCQEKNKSICLEVLSEFDNFELIEKKSEDVVDLFEDESFDYIFIDGLHTYEQCSKDINNYYSKLKVGGIFSGHDYIYCDGVNKAVNEFAEKNNKTISNCKNDVWYWEK